MKTAVISGGAGGLGLALCDGLEARGWRVFLLDIAVEGVERTETRIPMRVDLTNAADLEAAAATILADYPAIDLVVYNAGVSHIAPFSEGSEAAHRRLFEINYFAAVAMARAFLGAVRAAGGTHLAVSSVAGFSPLRKRTAYAASKHAMQGFFSSLRSEEAAYGVRTLIAAPSFVATNPGNAAKTPEGMVRPGSAPDGMDHMTPAEAAAAILRGLERERRFIPVGRVAWLSWLINRMSPTLFEWLMRRNVPGGRPRRPD